MQEESILLKVNWDDIKFFLYLARHQRLTKVANLLDTSHVTVANRIAAFEDALDLQLFTRTPEGFILTKSGRKLLKYSESIEREFLHGIRENTRRSASRPTVRVGVTEGFGDYYLVKIITQAAIAASIDVDYISLPKMTNITSKTVDISIGLEKPDSEYVIRRKLTDYKLFICASKQYIKEHGIIDRASVQYHQWIGYIDHMLYTDELRYHKEISSSLNFIFRSTSIKAQLEATLLGAGLAILPKYMMYEHDSLVQVMPELEFKRTYWISSNYDLHRFEPLRIMWDSILAKSEQNQDMLN